MTGRSNLPDGAAVPCQKYIRRFVLDWTRELHD